MPFDNIYPGAKLRSLTVNFRQGTIQDKNTIVLHIAEGSHAEGAIAWFSNPRSQVSAHFIVDQDGTIYQLLSLSDTAWHASQANQHSIGIEHIAISGGKLPITPVQLIASGQLVKWLASKLKLPLDRAHIRSHNEASPRDGHVLCCAPTLQPDDVLAAAKKVDNA